MYKQYSTVLYLAYLTEYRRGTAARAFLARGRTAPTPTSTCPVLRGVLRAVPCLPRVQSQGTSVHCPSTWPPPRPAKKTTTRQQRHPSPCPCSSKPACPRPVLSRRSLLLSRISLLLLLLLSLSRARASIPYPLFSTIALTFPIRRGFAFFRPRIAVDDTVRHCQRACSVVAAPNTERSLYFPAPACSACPAFSPRLTSSYRPRLAVPLDLNAVAAFSPFDPGIELGNRQAAPPQSWPAAFSASPRPPFVTTASSPAFDSAWPRTSKRLRVSQSPCVL